MGKFGGFSGSFKSSSLGQQANKALSSLQSRMSNMSPEEVTKIMDKATVGNAASFIGSKIGLNINGSKIDGILNRYHEARYAVQNYAVQALLGAVEKAGYSISIPDGNKIAEYIMSNGIMDKIEGLGENISTNGIDSVIKSIDIHKFATDVGLGIKKVPTKIESKEEAAQSVANTSAVVLEVLKNMGVPLGDGIINIAGEVGSAVSDTKTILENKGE